MTVPFLSLKDITAKYADEIHEAALRVIDGGWYLQGKRMKPLSSIMLTISVPNSASVVPTAWMHSFGSTAHTLNSA